MICSTLGGMFGLIARGAGGSCVTCLTSTSPIDSPSNGSRPVVIWNSRMPSA